MIGKTGQWDKDGSSGISNLESARGEQVWLMAREELQPQRPGGLARRTSLELVVRRALSVRRRIVAWRARPGRANNVDDAVDTRARTPSSCCGDMGAV